MADEIPPAPSESEDASKAETIRITLPPKQEQQAVKRETVRINLPARTSSPLGTSPKKETTKLPSGASLQAPSAPSAPSFPKPPSAPAVPPPPSSGPKPFVPPPPKPLGGSGSGIAPAPGGIVKPVGVSAPPKPPSLGPSKPTVPLKPVPPPASGATTPAPAPAARTAAPKKEDRSHHSPAGRRGEAFLAESDREDGADSAPGQPPCGDRSVGLDRDGARTRLRPCSRWNGNHSQHCGSSHFLDLPGNGLHRLQRGELISA